MVCALGSCGLLTRWHVVPRWSMYYFGLKSTIQALFDRPSFLEFFNMGLNRDTSPGSYRASAAAKKTRDKLEQKVPGSNIFDDITSFLFDLGMDFLTVNSQSVGVLGLRARDVPRHVQGRDACIAMLAIFLKSEPAKYVHGFMDQPLRDINAAIYNKISITVNKIEHFFVPIFTTFMADLPARMKLTRCLGHSSGCPCMACKWYTPGQHPKHKEYNVQQEIEWTDPVTFITAIYTGHPHQDHMQLTDEQYDARGLLAQQEVEAALAAARAANKPLKDSSIVYSAACRGARGVCVVTQHLSDFASSLDAFVMPTYHTFCLGVLRDFIEYLLSTASSLSTQAKTTIRERQAALHIPTDYGRKPTCCIDDRGHWIIEDYLHFIFTTCTMMFAGLLDYKQSRLLGYLRTAALHYLRPGKANASFIG
ncbi:hypothetical protein V8C86DRAFT_2438496 [Haematococcus lacustris]